MTDHNNTATKLSLFICGDCHVLIIKPHLIIQGVPVFLSFNDSLKCLITWSIRNIILPHNQQNFIRTPNKCESCFWCNFYGSRIMITSIHNPKWKRISRMKWEFYNLYLDSSKISRYYLILNNSNHIYISLIFFINFYTSHWFSSFIFSFRKKPNIEKV